MKRRTAGYGFENVPSARRSQLDNANNTLQRGNLRVLCVCSAGLLRSPTAAVILAQDYSHNTRSCGLEQSYALIPITEALLYWADEVVCMTRSHERELKAIMKCFEITQTPVICLDIPDDFGYMDAKLVEMIKTRYPEAKEEKRSEAV